MPHSISQPVAILVLLLAVNRMVLSGEQAQPSDIELLPSFFNAIRNGDVDGMTRILKEHPEQIQARDNRDWTTLMLAAFYADADCMRLCIKHGVNVAAKNEFGTTALHYAVADPDKVSALLNSGADVNATTQLGNTPLILAARSSRSATMVRLLLDNQANPDASNAKKETALIVAASAGDLQSVKMLLEHRGDLEVQRKSLDIGLVHAIAAGHLDVAELLLNEGADVNGRAVFDWPVLTLAAAMNRVRIARLLLDRGARVDDVRLALAGAPGDGGTPIVWAAENEDGDDRLVKLLLYRG